METLKDEKEQENKEPPKKRAKLPRDLSKCSS